MESNGVRMESNGEALESIGEPIREHWRALWSALGSIGERIGEHWRALESIGRQWESIGKLPMLNTVCTVRLSQQC